MMTIRQDCQIKFIVFHLIVILVSQFQGCSSIKPRQPTRTLPSLGATMLFATATPEDLPSSTSSEVIRRCAMERSVDASDVISILERMEQLPALDRERIDVKSVSGEFELIFSSAVAKLPLLGSWFNGYMPNRETITFDTERKQMSLIVELLPFLPKINIYGDELTWDEKAGVLEYTVKRGKEENPAPSRWTVLYADDEVVAARSSVTGLNVIRRTNIL